MASGSGVGGSERDENEIFCLEKKLHKGLDNSHGGKHYKLVGIKNWEVPVTRGGGQKKLGYIQIHIQPFISLIEFPPTTNRERGQDVIDMKCYEKMSHCSHYSQQNVLVKDLDFNKYKFCYLIYE